MRTSVRMAAGVGIALPLALGWCIQAAAQAKPVSQATPRGRTTVGGTSSSTNLRDLQGTWTWATVTPLQRPAALANKEVLTPEEQAVVEQQSRASQQAAESRPARRGDVGYYNQFWLESGTKSTGRSSLLVDPPDGRMPPMTPAARERMRTLSEKASRPGNPEDFWPWERCLIGFNAGPPIIGTDYNANLQIVQTPDYVVIATEMVHDARIIPLTSKPALPANFRQWRGTSSGHWEGDTLVIETRNVRREGTGILHLQERSLGFTDENLHVIERLRRVDADTLSYEYTVDDPTVWTKPWSVSMPMAKTDALIYEYACHEGNYSVSNILKGARREEQSAPEQPAASVR
jgi:hypothetical protein